MDKIEEQIMLQSDSLEKRASKKKDSLTKKSVTLKLKNSRISGELEIVEANKNNERVWQKTKTSKLVTPKKNYIFDIIKSYQCSVMMDGPGQYSLNLLRKLSLPKIEVTPKSKRNQSNEHISPMVNELKKKTTKFLYHLKNKIIQEECSLEKGVYFELEPNVKTRDHMEDYINIENIFNNDDGLSKHRVYVLCDGHGGHLVAETVSKKLPEIFFTNLSLLKEEMKSETEQIIAKEAMKKSFFDVDEFLRNMENEELDSQGATTNLIYLCQEDNKRVIYSGNVGDSRTVLVRKDQAIRLSYDHKAIDKSEIARVRNEGGIIKNKRFYGVLAITRSLADFRLKDLQGLSNEPYITRTEITDDDKFLVIASDGIWDVITDQQTYDFANTQEFLELNKTDKNLAKFFVKKAMDSKSKDNISCIIVKL